jgi:hypothetical protein
VFLSASNSSINYCQQQKEKWIRFKKETSVYSFKNGKMQSFFLLLKNVTVSGKN